MGVCLVTDRIQLDTAHHDQMGCFILKILPGQHLDADGAYLINESTIILNPLDNLMIVAISLVHKVKSTFKQRSK